MKVTGTCPNCKRDDAPIDVLEISEENQYRGRCLACGLAVEGNLLLRTVIETFSEDKPHIYKGWPVVGPSNIHVPHTCPVLGIFASG
jgi:hypothetical protein